MTALWAEGLGDVINMGKGHPSPSLLPLAQVKEAFQAASATSNATVDLLQYGRMQGNAALCEEISAWMTGSGGRKRAMGPENILVTAGAGPALSVICQIFTKPGDVIFIDSPAYFLSFYTFVDCRLQVVEIPTDEHGISVDDIEARLKAGERPSMVYTVPIANNPTGVSMSDGRRRRLVELSREYDFKIAADEVYMFLTFDEQQPKSLFDFDDPKKPTVFSINSFSKIIGPGLRLGWVETDTSHMPRLLNCGSLQSGGGFQPFTGAVILEMLKCGAVHRQIKSLKAKYRVTSAAMCTALEEHIPSALLPGEKMSFRQPRGGFFCFVTLPPRITSQKLLEQAKEKFGVSFFAGQHFSEDKRGYQSSLRLCFTFLEPSVIIDGVKRLASAIKAYEPEPELSSKE